MGSTGDHCISARKQKSLQMQAFCECVSAHHVVAQTSNCGAANAYSVVRGTLTGSDCWLQSRRVRRSMQGTSGAASSFHLPMCSRVFPLVPKKIFTSSRSPQRSLLQRRRSTTQRAGCGPARTGSAMRPLSASVPVDQPSSRSWVILGPAIQDPCERRPCSGKFQLKALSRAPRYTQPTADYLPRRMPEIDHAQQVAMPGMQGPPCFRDPRRIDRIVGAARCVTPILQPPAQRCRSEIAAHGAPPDACPISSSRAGTGTR